MLKKTFIGLISLVCAHSMLHSETPSLKVEVSAESQAKESPNATATERTLVLIKPNAIKGDHIGDIIARFEKNGLHVVALKLTHLTQAQAQQFYSVHVNRPFFPNLVTFMSSGPIVAIVLEGPQAVAQARKVIGATDPAKAVQGSIRADFGQSVSENAVHGTDVPENAQGEISFFFRPQDIFKHN
jgi:nucleoside-diphosphate kinase